MKRWGHLPHTLMERDGFTPPSKPSQNDIDYVLNGFGAQLPGVQVNDCVRSTFGLEGWGSRADGSPLPAHNHVHDWVGGVMSNTSHSPTDPIFWLHHAEVDDVMDPWPEQY